MDIYSDFVSVTRVDNFVFVDDGFDQGVDVVIVEVAFTIHGTVTKDGVLDSILSVELLDQLFGSQFGNSVKRTFVVEGISAGSEYISFDVATA